MIGVYNCGRLLGFTVLLSSMVYTLPCRIFHVQRAISLYFRQMVTETKKGKGKRVKIRAKGCYPPGIPELLIDAECVALSGVKLIIWKSTVIGVMTGEFGS